MSTDLKPYMRSATRVLAYRWLPEPKDTEELPAPGVFSEQTPGEAPFWLGTRLRYYVMPGPDTKVYLDPGDWVVQEPDGVYYRKCDPHTFAKDYRESVTPDRVAELEAVLRQGVTMDISHNSPIKAWQEKAKAVLADEAVTA